MLYRTLAGERVSQLGFGAMRLPTLGGKINRAETTRMVRSAIDSGLNYIDTAYIYHGGESEEAIGEALQDGWRDKVFLATKSPIWLLEDPEDFPRILEEQLKRLGTDHIDFYLLHSLGVSTWDKCKRFDAIGFCERAKAQGKIRHYGFSFHDAGPIFLNILESHPWEFCQIQYNYLDRDYQAGQKGLDAALAQGTDVIVMEPLRGGNLAQNVPPSVQALWDGAPTQWSPAEWALRWIWNNPGISILLSGMTTQAQVDENLAIAANAQAHSLTAQELNLIDQAERTYRSLIQVGCTACRYCMPCPQGVDIPRNFSQYNEYFMFNQSEAAKGGYQWIPAAERADHCISCGVCVDLCPQQIDIPGIMGKVKETFSPLPLGLRAFGV